MYFITKDCLTWNHVAGCKFHLQPPLCHLACEKEHFREGSLVIMKQQLCSAEVGAQDVRGLPLWAKPAHGQSCSPMAGKPMPSSHWPPHQWNQAPVTLIYQWKIKWGERWGKSTIQKLNEESAAREHHSKHIELMQARLTAFEPLHWLLTLTTRDGAPCNVTFVKFHLTS